MRANRSSVSLPPWGGGPGWGFFLPPLQGGRGQSRRRAGYTLLEVLLASVLAVILLAALYATLDVTLLRMDVGRDMVSSNNLSRAVVNRMGADLTGVLGPLPPKSGGTSSTTSTPPISAESGETPPSETTGETEDPTTGIEGDSMSPDSQAVFATDIPVQSGVIGTDRQFTIFTSRVPDSLINPEAAADPTLLLPGDQRRITYYMASDGLGLCRQERPWVTADGVRNSIDPDYSTETTDLIAPEVTEVIFEYLDAATGEFLTEWDGSLAGADGVTPSGPPRAIRVTFLLEFPGHGGEILQKQVQQVFPVRAAIGTYVPPTELTDTIDPAMEGM